MKNPCNNDLIMTTQSAACFAAFRQKISEDFNPCILMEYMGLKGCFLHIDFISNDSFPLEQFHELTRHLDDPTLKIRVVSLCPATMQVPVQYEYKEKIWMWQEDEGRTTIAVPDDLHCPGQLA